MPIYNFWSLYQLSCTNRSHLNLLNEYEGTRRDNYLLTGLLIIVKALIGQNPKLTAPSSMKQRKFAGKLFSNMDRLYFEKLLY